MHILFDLLAGLRERPLGTLLIVGAGDGLALDLRRLEALAPKRLLLVEGDPETAAALEQRCGRLAWAEVRPQVVAPRAGVVRWPRWSLPAFNGLADVSALQGFYPRLRAIDERERQAIAFADVLDCAVPGHLNVLVMDVPGQEDGLLASVPTERLTAFDVVALRGCREALAAPLAEFTAAPLRLRRLSFRKKVIDAQSQPLWPLTVMRFDEAQHRIQQLERELAEEQAAHRTVSDKLVTLTAAEATLQRRLQDAERRTEEHLQQVRQLTRAGEADVALLEERDAQITRLVHERSLLQARLAEQAAQAAAAQAGQSSADQARQALQLEFDALREAHAVAQRRLEELSAQHNLLLADAAAAESTRRALEQRCTDAETQRSAAQRDAESLAAQLQAMHATQRQQMARQQLLQDELHRAEAQIELVKGLLLGDAGL